MGISGRPAEFDDKDYHRANIVGCRELLKRLWEFHGNPPLERQRETISIVPISAPKIAFVENKKEARFVRYRKDENGRRIPRVDEVKHLVALRYEVTPLNLDSRSRRAKFVWPRQIAMYLCHIMTLRSLPDIGRRFGGRDHTTVLHAIRKIERMEKTNPEIADLINEMKELLNEDDCAAVLPDETAAPAHQAAV